ncbi:MAG: transglycosylase domain-containing protein [Microbacterium sp.]
MPQTKRTVKGVLSGLAGLVGLSAVAGLLVTATMTPAIAMAGFAGSQAITLFDDLPSYLKPSTPMEPTTMWATGTDGKPFKLASFYEQNRDPVTFDQVSPVLFDAILSSEDKDFYEHGGVNLGATLKAVIENATGQSDRGASTITQQYVKNVLIQQCEQTVAPDDPDYDEKMNNCFWEAAQATGQGGIQRKLQEMRYALQIEKEYSKNDILLGYLNVSNFGGTTYGIEAAANYYFGVSAANVTVAQAATLAGMVQNPNSLRIDKPEGSIYDKKSDTWSNSKEDGYAETKDRRDYVINRMYALGKITEAQHDEALATPVEPSIHPATQGCAGAGRNAYFCQYVKTVLRDDPAFGATEGERLVNLQRGGMQVYTTLDMRVQAAGIDAMTTYVPTTMPGIDLGAAGVSIEASTGRILSIVQNTQFGETLADEEKPGVSGQVFAADEAHGGGIGFSVGSTYKVFTLLDWLEHGRSVNEMLDGRYRLITPFNTCDANGEPIVYNQTGDPTQNFEQNRGYFGTVMDFTAASLNTGYLTMAQQLNLCDINKVAKRLGVHLGDGWDVTVSDPDHNPGANDPFSSVLGSKNIAPIQMAGVYATIANQGKLCQPIAIDKVVGADGKEIKPPAQSCSQVITPEVAATAAYALQGVMRGNGSGSRSNPDDGTPLIGKTGTGEDAQTMMIESSTKVTTAIWVGNIKGDSALADLWTPEGTPEWDIRLTDLRHMLAPAIQHAANLVYGGDEFPEPDTNLTRRVLRDLPNVVGQTVDDATRTLEEAGFSVTVGAAVDSDQPTNIVAAQTPTPGQVPGGTTVTISPSNGKGGTVPNVVGMDVPAAQQALKDAGYGVKPTGKCDKDGATVESQDPGAGSKVNKGATVSLKCKAE